MNPDAHASRAGFASERAHTIAYYYKIVNNKPINPVGVFIGLE